MVAQKRGVKKPSKKKVSKSKKNVHEHDLYEHPLMDEPLDNKKSKSFEKPVIEILKAKIRNDNFLSASWKNLTDIDKGLNDRDGENIIHQDCRNAFAQLNVHLARLAYQYNEKGKFDTGNIVCKGFSVGANGEGVTLHGTRILGNGKPFNFNSPFYKWDTEDGESIFGEDDSSSLKGAINTCRAEVIKYLFHHKYQEEILGKEEE